MKQTESLKAHYQKMSEEYRAEARYCEGKQWWHLAAVQHKLADGWLAKSELYKLAEPVVGGLSRNLRPIP